MYYLSNFKALQLCKFTSLEPEFESAEREALTERLYEFTRVVFELSIEAHRRLMLAILHSKVLRIFLSFFDTVLYP